MTFQELGLNEPILRALADQGYEQPSPIQAKAIPPALTGRDVLGCAQTGTGKTCAFAAPILQQLSGRKAQGRPIRALILTPTRELALQIQESFEAYGKYLPLRSTVIFGGVGQAPQVERLKKGVDILVATPGRLGDLYGQKLIDLSRLEISCWTRPTGCWTWASSTTCAASLAGCPPKSRPSSSPPPCPPRCRGW